MDVTALRIISQLIVDVKREIASIWLLPTLPIGVQYKLSTRSFFFSKSEEIPLLRLVVEDASPAERGRYRLFVGDGRVEVGFGVEPGFGRADEAF